MISREYTEVYQVYYKIPKAYQLIPEANPLILELKGYRSLTIA